jgi:branched-chain amino acid transport system ATP-binding protein
LPSHAIVSRGIARSFQVTNVFPELTVADNFRVAVLSTARRSPWRTGGADGAPARSQLLREMGLWSYAELPCAALSRADRRLVDIGLAPGVYLLLLTSRRPAWDRRRQWP